MTNYGKTKITEGFGGGIGVGKFRALTKAETAYLKKV